ncbi:dihydrodipicolinate synthase family protein [Agriterribacter sp.]|uniref:dihydrodipicolinate synthase family protein n=1 Tax=Agriterribacter sp. TaxID=2821509 RepID=UPI002C15BF1E|nr:dihydrodipicolinate synthase family protein [Agriterribacter sp.]HRP54907.1 dihydrodipicolinate synthase family protein [Agriterribacter sp.]
MSKIQGLIAAAFTPFKEDGSVNFEMIPELVEKLVQDGLQGAFVCGSNGEGPNMTTAERIQVSEAFIKSAAKRIKIIVHVGHSSIQEARTLAAHAERAGADAVSSVAAFYFKPTSVSNLAAAIAAIAEAAPSTPFYYYHIPQLTGIAMDMIEFMNKAQTLIPNLAGIKYTAASINEFQLCLRYQHRKFDILYGYDELLLPALSVGAVSAIGSTYTFAAPCYLKTIDLFNSGNFRAAEENHSFMVEAIKIFAAYPPIPAQKAIMTMLGWDMGPSRLPLQTLSKADFDTLYDSLRSISFFDKVPVRQTHKV